MTAPSSKLDEYKTHFNTISNDIFSKAPYQWQTELGASILHTKLDTDDDIHQLCVRPTGGGKSLLFTTLAVCLGNLTLAITPLLSLGADQTIKHQHNTFGARHILNSVHLDEISNDVDMKLAITEIERNINTFSTIVYASPQSLITTEGGPSLFLSFILQNPTFVSMIVIDEIHLLNEFGRSFRKEFQMLKTALFQKIQKGVPMLSLTATCTTSILTSYENLIGVKCNHIHWPSPINMVNRKVRIKMLYTPLWYNSVQKNVKSYLIPNKLKRKKVIIYSNSRKRVIKLVDKLESYLDTEPALCTDCDVLTLVGTQSRAQKASTINGFINGFVGVDCNPDILCATSGVGNAGIDCSDIRAVYRVDFPPSISDMSQELGRAGRNDDATPDEYMYQVAIHIDSFLYIYKRINDKQTRTVDPIHRRYQIDELMDAAKLFASSNTCYYVAMEMRLGNPNGDRTAPPPCGVCPNCEKVKIFPRINKDGLKSALFDIFISGSNICTPQHVCECLRDYPDFGVNVLKAKAKSKIQVSAIKKIVFQLIAFHIIDLKYNEDQSEIILCLARCNTKSTDLAMNSDTFWNEMQLLA